MNRLLQLICVMLVFTSGTLFAQPANDNCGGALPIVLAADEASVVLVEGDTRGATGDLSVPNVCSGSWFMDDIWYTVTTGDEVPVDGITVAAYFGTEADDIPEVGLGIYPSCDSSAAPLVCFSDAPGVNTIELVGGLCTALEANTTYYVRVWSAGHATDFSGTLRMGAYESPAGETSTDNVLWEEQFDGGLNGWTTGGGTCATADSNHNAVWHWLPMGLLDGGNYANVGNGLAGPTWCNGAVGVDSDFNDNGGPEGSGVGPCPAPGEYFIVSPAIYTAGWGVPGITIQWHQAVRNWQSTFTLSFRTALTGGTWGDWNDIAINEQYELNGPHVADDVERWFLGGAADGDSLQVRFIYSGNYYYWGIDDITLIETEAHNMQSMSNWYAIAPAYTVPVGQETGFYGMNDIRNKGARSQDNVNLNLRIVNPDGNEFFNSNLGYGTIGPDSLAENVNFPDMVHYSGNSAGEFLATYTVTSDSCMEDTDFDWTDNQNSFSFRTNEEGWYQLEDEITNSYWLGPGAYDDAAPYSLTWGNAMYFPNGSNCEVEAVSWGFVNPDAIPGVTMNVILFKWTDLDDNQIVQANEREIIGFAAVPIVGDEGDENGQARFETVLENFVDFGEPIVLEDGTQYLVMVEYNAIDQAVVFFNSNDEIDYGAVALSSDQAGKPVYMGVTGASPDGNIQGIDYQVRNLGNGASFFGHDVIAAVRMKVKSKGTATKDLLSNDNLVEVFPNPTNQLLNVSLDFTEVYDEVSLQIMDITGKLVDARVLSSIQNETLEMNVSQYANGAYILKVQTEDGSRTKRFVVQH